MRIDYSSNRLFGCVLIAGIAVVEVHALWLGARLYPWLLELVGVIAVVTALRPEWLSPLRRGAASLSNALRRLLSPLLLGLLFYGVFTPLGLIMRLWGRDLMKRKFEPQALTYWVRRVPRALTAESFREQF